MKSDRDIDKVYPLPDFVAKLRRLADALEAGDPFDIQIAGERIYVPSRAIFSIEHEREAGAEEIEFQLRWELEEGEDDDAAEAQTQSLAGDAAS